MAARKTWISYVYTLTYGDDILYVGKGTGRRLINQVRDFGLSGCEVAWFKTERDAYLFEKQMISDYRPRLNISSGGNGSTSIRRREPRLPKVYKIIEKIGTRAMAARIVYHCWKKGLIVMPLGDALEMRRIGYAS